MVLSPARIRQRLAPFDLDLSPTQINLVSCYLDLLLKWNRKINLTSIRDPETCVTRHFGESLFLARHADLNGRLLDIGSGAGFPGLALKIVFPEVNVTLLEPIAKKRAFLKEVIRVCGFGGVEVLPDRAEQYARSLGQPSFEAATSRAVGHLPQLIPETASCLKASGRVYLWLTRDRIWELSKVSSPLNWEVPITIPGSEQCVICLGTKRA